jgi:hypothetical protein
MLVLKRIENRLLGGHFSRESPVGGGCYILVATVYTIPSQLELWVRPRSGPKSQNSPLKTNFSAAYDGGGACSSPYLISCLHGRRADTPFLQTARRWLENQNIQPEAPAHKGCQSNRLIQMRRAFVFIPELLLRCHYESRGICGGRHEIPTVHQLHEQ